MRPLSILFLLLAVTLIALGRHHIRARHRLTRRSPLGWSLTALGFLLMLAGVILW